ncbi:MAG: hypothetical protein BZ134_00180 [Methanosphaera sp. SHI1033]|nr:MAG: hypothetical protein BZ134_00180 [Methanosphaera sp. SHI1033]
MIHIKTRNVLHIRGYSEELFKHQYTSKEKMILEDDSYITRQIDSTNPSGAWNYYNKNNKFIRKIQIDEYPFKGVIPENGDEEDDQYGVIYFADVNITINDFEKEKLDIIMLKKVQEKMNKQIPLSNLEKGLKIFFFKTIEEGEKGWCPNDYWLPYTICSLFNRLDKTNARINDKFWDYLMNNLDTIYELSQL